MTASGFSVAKKASVTILATEVEFIKRPAYDVRVALTLQRRGDRRSYQAKVPGDIYFGIFI